MRGRYSAISVPFVILVAITGLSQAGCATAEQKRFEAALQDGGYSVNNAVEYDTEDGEYEVVIDVADCDVEFDEVRKGNKTSFVPEEVKGDFFDAGADGLEPKDLGVTKLEGIKKQDLENALKTKSKTFKCAA